MGGLVLLLALSVIMAAASFLAGLLPLSVALSPSRLRLISSIGVGILVGTSLVVIIPEGIGAVSSTDLPQPAHGARQVGAQPLAQRDLPRWVTVGLAGHDDSMLSTRGLLGGGAANDEPADKPEAKAPAAAPADDDGHRHRAGLPTFSIGLSLILGFVLMFLIDRLPRHATEQLQAAPATRHISLDNLETGSIADDDAGVSSGLLASLAPSPRQSRSFATTAGLVIHAAADGIAMGASATTKDMKLGLIIFAAIMIHKAPAAFGLTSVLLKQGQTKRSARAHLLVFSLAAPFGALATYIIISLVGARGASESESGQWWTGMLLLFSAGTFLYVAMHAMQEDGAPAPRDHSSANGFSEAGSRPGTRPQMRDTLATVAGMLIPLVTQLGHAH